MKCSVCKGKIEETFLDKILGTYVKDEKGKKHAVCIHCQREHSNDKDAMLAAMKSKSKKPAKKKAAKKAKKK